MGEERKKKSRKDREVKGLIQENRSAEGLVRQTWSGPEEQQ